MAGEQKKHRFSPNEQVIFVALLTILALSSAVFGILVFVGNNGCGAFGPEPCPALETLNILSTTVNSPTSVTLQVVNSGVKTVSMIAYYVKNVNGTTYANSNWSGPTIQPNGMASVNITIDGAAFTFRQGYSYTVTVITATNDQFTFTIQA